jgi:hypothetical protein
MSSEEENLSKIEEVIRKHIGKKNAINSREVARIIGIEEKDQKRAFVKTRNLIRKVMKRTQLPIGANENYGYFIIEKILVPLRLIEPMR